MVASLTTFLLPLLLVTATWGGPYEKVLLDALMKNYNTQNRPVLNETSPLDITFGVNLQQLVDLDEKNQLLTTCLWLQMSWRDYQLTWNSSEYGGVDSVVINPRHLWIPDLLLYNSADERFDGTFQTNIVVSKDGSMLYVPPGIFKSTCKIDITWFPFDDQHCDLKFGSWTYSGWKLDLALQSEDGGDLSGFMPNGEWKMLGMPGARSSIVYTTGPEPYVDITFTIKIRRRTLYYFFNLIVPCVLISSMALLGFTLPPDAGEKLTLGVTVMLSLTVFMNIVSELMPITSDAVPLIGTYFNFIMGMVASSVVLTVLVLNYHHRTPETHDMPPWAKKVLLQWLPWLLRYNRPSRKITRKSIQMENRLAAKCCSGPPSPHLTHMQSYAKTNGTSNGGLDNSHRLDPTHLKPSSDSAFRPVTGEGLPFLRSFNNPMDEEPFIGCATHSVHTCRAVQNDYGKEIKQMLKEIRYMTKRMRDKDEEEVVINDWKFAAMVIDRFCLFGLTLYTMLTTLVLLTSAPHGITL